MQLQFNTRLLTGTLGKTEYRKTPKNSDAQ